MPSYRLYRVDGTGKITSAEWIEAADDAGAERLVREQIPDGIAEIWERDRLVARLGAGGRSPGTQD